MAAILVNDIFKYIFLNETDRIPIQVSLIYVFRSPVDNKPALVQIMAWCRRGDKPISEPILTQFIDAYIFGTRGRWVNIDKAGKPPWFLDCLKKALHVLVYLRTYLSDCRPIIPNDSSTKARTAESLMYTCVVAELYVVSLYCTVIMRAVS